MLRKEIQRQPGIFRNRIYQVETWISSYYLRKADNYMDENKS